MENNNENLKQEVLKRMRNEFKKFVVEQLEKLPDEYRHIAEELLEASYEKVCKEELIYAMESNALSEETLEALSKTEHPLDECYEAWLNADSSTSLFEEGVLFVEDRFSTGR